MYHKTSLSSPRNPPAKESKRNKVEQADQRPKGRPNNVPISSLQNFSLKKVNQFLKVIITAMCLFIVFM